MIEDVYVSFICKSKITRLFISLLIDTLEAISLPGDLGIVKVQHDLCYLSYQIMKHLCIVNDHSTDYKKCFKSRKKSEESLKIFMLKISIDTSSSIYLKEILWLENAIRDFVRNFKGDNPFLYYFYPITNPDNMIVIKKGNILKYDSTIIEDIKGDDFNFIDEYAEYIVTLLYSEGQSSAVARLYPDKTALLLLREIKPSKDCILPKRVNTKQ